VLVNREPTEQGGSDEQKQGGVKLQGDGGGTRVTLVLKKKKKTVGKNNAKSPRMEHIGFIEEKGGM